MGGSCRRATLTCSLKRRRFAALHQGPTRRHPLDVINLRWGVKGIWIVGWGCRRATLMCSLKRRRFAALHQGPARRHPSRESTSDGVYEKDMDDVTGPVGDPAVLAPRPAGTRQAGG
jgi:hypothetical protein